MPPPREGFGKEITMRFARRLSLGTSAAAAFVVVSSHAWAQAPAATEAQPSAPVAPVPPAAATPPADAKPVPAEAAPAAAAPAPAPTPAAAATSPLPAAPPQPVAPAPEPTPPPTNEALAADGKPLAGWYGGMFYMRDAADDFRLYVQGRAQVDMYNYFGPGVADTTLKSNVLLRRIRPELAGEILGRWQFMLAGDWGQTGMDNAKGTNETSAAKLGTAPTADTARFASAQTTAVKGAPTDVFINFRAVPEFNLMAGQYNAPFMMENMTSDKYGSFMERSLAVRAFGIPTNKEIGLTAWGEVADRMLTYYAGVFAGDGMNRPNVDNRADVMGRVFVRPLSRGTSVLKDLQVGASGRAGGRDNNYVSYDYPQMTTESGYAFWTPTYQGSAPTFTGGTNGWVHVIPSGAQMAVAGEIRLPVADFDVTSEVVYLKNRTREAAEGAPQTTLRAGDMHGVSYYVELGYWPLGNRDINGIPGTMKPAHIDFKKAPSSPKQALQLLVKWEQLSATYSGASRVGTPDAKGIDGDIKVNAFSLGANYWATKHLRLSANYVVNMFPDSAPSGAQTAAQRAVAPGNTLAKGINDSARNDAQVLHELMFRVGVAF
jgi:phosphate-selective porin